MNKQRIEALKAKENYKIGDLIEIMSILREPGGCPWDREQNHHTIRRNLIEETYEVVEATTGTRKSPARGNFHTLRQCLSNTNFRSSKPQRKPSPKWRSEPPTAA